MGSHSVTCHPTQLNAPRLCLMCLACCHTFINEPLRMSSSKQHRCVHKLNDKKLLSKISDRPSNLGDYALENIKKTRKPSWRKGYARQRRHSKMAVSCHLGYYRTGNSAIRSADPENPCLEPHMEWIRCTVWEIFAFKLYCDLETGIRGHSRSLKVAPWDRPTPKTSY